MRILETPIKKLDLINSSSNFIDENAIKAVVDVAREIIAVDSGMHYECEQLLLENGSNQQDLWGINLASLFFSDRTGPSAYHFRQTSGCRSSQTCL